MQRPCTISPLPSFAAASYCCGVSLLSREYALNTRHSPHHTKFLTAGGIGFFPRAASGFQPEETRAARVVAVVLRIFCRHALRCCFCSYLIPFFVPPARTFLRNTLRPGALGNLVPTASFQRLDALPAVVFPPRAETFERAERRQRGRRGRARQNFHFLVERRFRPRTAHAGP